MKPAPGQLEERTADGVEIADRRVRGVIPFDTLSADLGGWREKISSRAFRGTCFDELRVTVDHRGVPLGRYPATLDIEERDDGLHWSLDPPKSRADVVEAIERGDIRAGSWRMMVSKDSWEGDTRTVEAISELLDVCIVGADEPAYPTAAVELRCQPEPEETAVSEVTTRAGAPESPQEVSEPRSVPTPPQETPSSPGGALRVEGRSSSDTTRTLADAFKSRGFPHEKATIAWEEFESRAIIWTPPVTDLNQLSRVGVPLPLDRRYLWPVFPRQGVSDATTSVQTVSQTERELPDPDDVIRDLAETTEKPEVESVLDVDTIELKQLAVTSGKVSNILLRQPLLASVLNSDMRIAFNEALDAMILAALDDAATESASSGSDPLFAGIRRAITVLEGIGYSPDVVVLSPADDEALDLAQDSSGDWLWAPDRAPSVYGLRRRIAKGVTSPYVIDTNAFGRLYAGPVSAQSFEQDGGATNQTLLRLEGNAAFGIERPDAACEIS